MRIQIIFLFLYSGSNLFLKSSRFDFSSIGSKTETTSQLETL